MAEEIFDIVDEKGQPTGESLYMCMMKMDR